jgi:hypothetical protein
MFDWVIVWSIVLGLSLFSAISVFLFITLGLIIVKEKGNEE